MADALVEAGVRRIEGRLVGHEGAFGGDRRGADWMLEDLAWGYGAEVSALTFNDNVVHVTLTPGERPGDPAVLEVVPRTSFVTRRVDRRHRGRRRRTRTSSSTGRSARTASSCPECFLEAGSGTKRWRWRTRPSTRSPSSPRCCQAKGIAVTGGVATSSDPLPAGARVLAVHEGVPVARLIEEVNKESQNLHAELLLRLLGLQVLGRRDDGEGTRGGRGVSRPPRGVLTTAGASRTAPACLTRTSSRPGAWSRSSWRWTGHPQADGVPGLAGGGRRRRHSSRSGCGARRPRPGSRPRPARCRE